MCAVDRGVNEEEPVSEQFCEQENEDRFRDPEPEGQDFPEGYEDGSCAVCYDGRGVRQQFKT